jgi:hypothetical protein
MLRQNYVSPKLVQVIWKAVKKRGSNYGRIYSSPKFSPMNVNVLFGRERERERERESVSV